MLSKKQIINRIKMNDKDGYWYPDALPECTPADVTTPHEREELGNGDIEKGNEIVWSIINTIN